MMKFGIIFSIVFILLGAGYSMAQYRMFGGPDVAHAINADFNYAQQVFQEEEISSQAVAPLSSIKVPIFIYHSVRPYIQGESIIQDRFDITPELFEEQLVYLRDHGYTTIGMDDLDSAMSVGTSTLPTKPVILTFDDGWENQYHYAFPLLKKYHMTATFYVFTKPIDAHNAHYLTWDQVREMDAAGMTIGSHTLSHPMLKSSSPVDMKKEIVESKEVIERELKKSVLYFAQPFGSTNGDIEAVIKNAGYSMARGVKKGVYHSKDSRFNLNGYFVSDRLNDFVYVLSR